MTDAAALLGLPPTEPLPADDPVVPRLRAAVRADETPTAAVDVPTGVLGAALIAVLPDALERHRALGVPEGVTAATLSDVGRKIDAYGATVDIPWLIGLLRGDVLALGRLQFEREADPAGRAIHIPEDGSLTPDSVDASVAEARALFGEGTLICTSWLLDPTLSALPPGSNIVSFAQRFDIETAAPDASKERAADEDATAGKHRAGDEAAAKFVFRRPLAAVLDPAVTRPRTALERLVAEHLRAGGHWTEPRGVLRD
ncbi:acyltransferase domain-containing protein [Planctomonas psychrotolerans]|uniref:acyltransferase domain-containing protein n=1 Tax=Planctomonas psychrotolerans TaxID=2528712 RepID=UPI00123987C7|nr:acyltransferase domain-containing protein [Planctomonas psychrotolerans]